MSWVTIIWSMVASACLTLAAMHLLIWGRKRTAWASLLFAVMAVGTAAVAGGELWMMRAETAREFGVALRWSHVLYWVWIVSLVAFVRLYLRAGRPWLAWTVCVIRTVSLLPNFLVGENLNYRTITGLRHVPFLGESVAVAEGIVNPWIPIGQVSLVLLVIFAADATLTVWRRGDRQPLVWLGGAIVCFVMASIGLTVLRSWGVIHKPATYSLFFLGIVAMMAYEMTHEVLRAAQLSDDLRENKQRLDLAADSAGVGLWCWDFDTSLIWATEKARTLYGFSLDEPIPFEKFVSRLHPDDLDWVVHASRKCLQEGVDFRHDYRIVLPDGSMRWLKVVGKVFSEPVAKPKGLTGVSVDITEHKLAEHEIERQRNELAHISRASTLNQLASSIAHELNQPLGAILRNAEAGELFLQGPSPDLEEVRAILADIRRDNQRAGEVIERMRALMKQRQAERRRLDLDLLSDETLALVQSDAERRRVRLARESDRALPPVHGDQVQLQQVLLNLLLNAMEALGDNPPARRLVTVRTRSTNSMVEVTVSDSGCGISENELLRVFEPFFTSKPNGLGMGLAISRSIIEAHGGRLWAENNVAGGTTFSFTLPAAKGGDTE